MMWRNFKKGNPALMAGRKSKYHSVQMQIDGKKFASQKEARRYCELKMLQKAGEISDLQTQVKYVLIPAQREPDTVGKRGGIHKGRVIEHEVSYIADFQYVEKSGKLIVEDTKGFRTKEYVIKRKLMLYVHGIRIKET